MRNPNQETYVGLGLSYKARAVVTLCFGRSHREAEERMLQRQKGKGMKRNERLLVESVAVMRAFAITPTLEQEVMDWLRKHNVPVDMTGPMATASVNQIQKQLNKNPTPGSN